MSYRINNYRNVSPIIGWDEKIISALSYLTSGTVGFIWLIFSHFARKHSGRYLRFHIYQSIFIAIFLYLFSIVFKILFSIAQVIPFIGKIISNVVTFFTQYGLVFGQSIVSFALMALVIYLAGSAILGKSGRIPWISDMVERIV